MSREELIQTGARPALVLREVNGNLNVRGWDRGEVQIRSDDEEMAIESTPDSVVISSEGNCTLRVPFGASLVMELVEGNAEVTGVHGSINASRVQGHLRLRDVGTVTIEDAEGDVIVRQAAGSLQAENIAGNLQVEGVYAEFEETGAEGEAADEAQPNRAGGSVRVDSVQGNVRLQSTGSVTIHNVEGNCETNQIDGDVMIENVAGNYDADGVVGRIKVDSVSGNLHVVHVAGSVQIDAEGNAHLQLAMPPGAEHRVHAGGNLSCKIPVDASARVKLFSEGRIAVSQLPVTQNLNRRGNCEFTLGTGEGSLNLRAEGHLSLSGDRGEGTGAYRVDADTVTETTQQVVEQIEQQVTMVIKQLEEKLASLGSGDEIAARVQQKVQAAMRKAEEKVAEAMREAERHAEKHARRAERHSARWEARQRSGFTWPSPPPIPPAPRAPRPSEPVSDEERKMILRMLEEGKISAEEAEKLLAALQR